MAKSDNRLLSILLALRKGLGNEPRANSKSSCRLPINVRLKNKLVVAFQEEWPQIKVNC